MGNQQQAQPGQRFLIFLMAVTVSLAAVPVALPAVLANRSKSLPTLEAEQILASVVQLELYALAPDGGAAANGKTRYMLGRGQGTLVAGNGGAWLVTHNHWGPALANLAFARLYDASYLLLAELEGAEFRALIQASDAGTLVLRAPAGLERLAATNLQPSSQTRPGDTVWVTRHDPADVNQLVVLAARVQMPRTFQGYAVLALQTCTGAPLLPGDSGGGVWHDGSLMGNLWATEFQAAPVAQSIAGPAEGDLDYTDISYAAPFPEAVRNMLLDGTLAGVIDGPASLESERDDHLQP